jgi:hypothetical protein
MKAAGKAPTTGRDRIILVSPRKTAEKPEVFFEACQYVTSDPLFSALAGANRNAVEIQDTQCYKKAVIHFAQTLRPTGQAPPPKPPS